MLNTPNIRFKGFTEPWELREFSKQYVKVSEKNDLSFGTDKIISVANMYFKEDAKKSSDDYMRTYNVMRLGDIAFEGNKSKNYAHGRFVENTIGDGIVSHVFDVFRPIADYDLLFWKYIINNEGVMGRIMTRCTKASTMMTNLVADDFLKEKIAVPSLEEQSQIGTFLDRLDCIIALHQRKCDEMSELKKFMLQKMFPKKGEQFPEIRFNGFTDAWEQRKLGELIEKYEDPVETPHMGYERIGIRSHAKGIFHSYVEAGKELDTAKMHRVAADKFILNITFAWEHAVAITDESDVGKLVSHRFPQFSFGADLKPHFFKYVMLDKKFREHLELSSPGGAGRNRVLKIDDMLKYDVKLPSINEQIKIGQYFDSLDHLITLHQRKCDELKDIKKFMMQNMFPQKG
ncbi:MAG: restriction endonuclease subunit S [Acetatifactor sp.]|nr:restriction endonuclease subunit S [Acetatifactor sp.]